MSIFLTRLFEIFDFFVAIGFLTVIVMFTVFIILPMLYMLASIFVGVAVKKLKELRDK